MKSLTFAAKWDMDLKQQFDNAVADSKDLNIRPSNDTLLQLYALYKQSIEGDQENGPPSNPFDFVARAKYDAWVAMKGKSREA
ncbi:MAG TPA: acyl-CoA-binding protein, partial [Flavitalea sp.]|nr:acyl-CoA-binding protein [Flavitalea sp.]